MTRDVIVAFLTKDITTALKDGLQDAQSGKMHKLGDAIRPGEQPPPDSAAGGKQRRTPQEREAAGESAPGKCPFPGCNKNHWFHNCPQAKAAKAKADKAAAEEAKGKSKKAGQAKRLQDALDAAAAAQAALKVANSKLAESDVRAIVDWQHQDSTRSLDFLIWIWPNFVRRTAPGSRSTQSHSQSHSHSLAARRYSPVRSFHPACRHWWHPVHRQKMMIHGSWPTSVMRWLWCAASTLQRC